MPNEIMLLRCKPQPYKHCPKCSSSPFRAFLRGSVQSWWRKIFKKPYVVIICANCKEAVGWEKP